jgi:hypothetical protein
VPWPRGGIIRSTVKGIPSWDAPGMSAEERVAAGSKAARAMQIAFAFVAIAIRACVPQSG